MFTYEGTGTVEAPIASNKVGRVNFQGSYWLAQFEEKEQDLFAPKNSTVQVTGREGVTLLVKLDEGKTSPNNNDAKSSAPHPAKDNSVGRVKALLNLAIPGLSTAQYWLAKCF